MKRGDVWEAELGGKAGTRPVVILTRNAVIQYLNKITVAEITTPGKGYPTEVDIDHQANLSRHSFAQLDNVQTVPKQRLTKYLGTLNEDLLKAIGQKRVLALNLEDVFA